LKRGIVNTGIIGALAKALPIVKLPALLQAIEVEFKGNKGPENAEAARITYAHTQAE
jgi:pyruvate ferredoxin oxidoreductase gamma subunit